MYLVRESLTFEVDDEALTQAEHWVIGVRLELDSHIVSRREEVEALMDAHILSQHACCEVITIIYRQGIAPSDVETMRNEEICDGLLYCTV